MAKGNFIAYYRGSTQKQGKSGLGLEAQKEAVRQYLDGGKWQLIAEFKEIESGKRSDRPELAKALERCKMTGATLVIAKLDILSRNARFLLSIVEGTGDAGVVFCDLPNIPPGPMGKFFITQMASIAELEAGLISKRTKDALAAAKERGTKLGGWRGKSPPDWRKAASGRIAAADHFASRLAPTLTEMQRDGLSLNAMAAELKKRGILTPRGGNWTPTAVTRALARIATP